MFSHLFLPLEFHMQMLIYPLPFSILLPALSPPLYRKNVAQLVDL